MCEGEGRLRGQSDTVVQSSDVYRITDGVWDLCTARIGAAEILGGRRVRGVFFSSLHRGYMGATGPEFFEFCSLYKFLVKVSSSCVTAISDDLLSSMS